MARIVCFTDDPIVAQTVRQQLAGSDHDVLFLSASRLCDDVRSAVRSLAPDLILMELTSHLDNPHLYIFLRSDTVTRETPVLLLSNSARSQHLATILEANGVLLRPMLGEQLHRAVERYIPMAHELAA
jgi:CheY-like chemotaxis protein